MIGHEAPHPTVTCSTRTLADAMCRTIQHRELAVGAVITSESTNGKDGMIYHNRLRGVAGINGSACPSCEILATHLIAEIDDIHLRLRVGGYKVTGETR